MWQEGLGALRGLWTLFPCDREATAKEEEEGSQPPRASYIPGGHAGLARPRGPGLSRSQDRTCPAAGAACPHSTPRGRGEGRGSPSSASASAFCSCPAWLWARARSLSASLSQPLRLTAWKCQSSWAEGPRSGGGLGGGGPRGRREAWGARRADLDPRGRQSGA